MIETIHSTASSKEEHKQAAISAMLDYLQTGRRLPDNFSPDFDQFQEFLDALSEEVVENPSDVKLRGRLVLALSAYRDLKYMWAPDYHVLGHGANRSIRNNYYPAREDVLQEVAAQAGEGGAL